MSKIKNVIERLKMIRHIITDDQYALYTMTVKDNKTISGRNCCYTSDGASDVFFDSIIDLTKQLRHTKEIFRNSRNEIVKSKTEIHLIDYHCGYLSELDVLTKSGFNPNFYGFIRDIENAIEENDYVTIVFPDNTKAVNPSFFYKVFYNSVVKFGKEEIFSKVFFHSKEKLNTSKSFSEGLCRIEREIQMT